MRKLIAFVVEAVISEIILILAAGSIPNCPPHQHVIMIKRDDKTLAQDLFHTRQRISVSPFLYPVPSVSH